MTKEEIFEKLQKEVEFSEERNAHSGIGGT